MERTFIIAEAGVNHNGDMSLAKELIDIAAEAKADAVKFQTFTTEEIISVYAPQAEYQKANTGKEESQFDMVKRLELPREHFKELADYAKTKNILFMSTAFDLANLEYLVKECDIPYIKIPSGEITNAPYLYGVARFRLPLILSTGMANLHEIEQALAILSYGWSGRDEPSSLQECLDYYETEEGKNILNGHITILQCTTEYPTPYEDVNLNAMRTIADAFGHPVGLSDHSLGIHIPVAAVAMGAQVIEKHFTKDCSLPGPDHKASLEPEELIHLVKHIRDVEAAMGSGVKEAQASEIKNIAIARRSLTAARDIQKGETYSKDNLACKRPGSGISAMKYWDYVGEECSQNIDIDQEIES